MEECIESSQNVRETIDKLSQIQDKSILIAMGINVDVSETDSDSDSDPEEVDSHHPVPFSSSDTFCKQDQDDPSILDQNQSSAMDLPDFHTLEGVLEHGRYNWFVVVEFLEQETQDSSDVFIEAYLKDFYSDVRLKPATELSAKRPDYKVICSF